MAKKPPKSSGFKAPPKGPRVGKATAKNTGTKKPAPRGKAPAKGAKQNPSSGANAKKRGNPRMNANRSQRY